jgi:hypothetical protein
VIQRTVTSLLKECLKGCRCIGSTTCGGFSGGFADKAEVVAPIPPLFIPDVLGGTLTAFMVGPRVVEFTHLTDVKVYAALDAGVSHSNRWCSAEGGI